MTIPLGDTAVAVGALRDRLRATLPPTSALNGVEVYDGPAPERAYAPRAVTVAAAFQDDQDAVTVERSESGARPTITERMTVAGSAYAGGGDVDADAARRAVSVMLTAIEDALRADRTLGGVVNMARLASAQWLQGRDTKGLGVMAGFTIELVVLR